MQYQQQYLSLPARYQDDAHILRMAPRSHDFGFSVSCGTPTPLTYSQTGRPLSNRDPLLNDPDPRSTDLALRRRVANPFRINSCTVPTHAQGIPTWHNTDPDRDPPAPPPSLIPDHDRGCTRWLRSALRGLRCGSQLESPRARRGVFLCHHKLQTAFWYWQSPPFFEMKPAPARALSNTIAGLRAVPACRRRSRRGNRGRPPGVRRVPTSANGASIALAVSS